MLHRLAISKGQQGYVDQGICEKLLLKTTNELTSLSFDKNREWYLPDNNFPENCFSL